MTDEATEILRSRTSCDSGDSDLLQYWKFGMQLLYILPAGILYGSFMITILRKRKQREIFDDSFFTLYLVDGLVTILFLLLDVLFMRTTAYVRAICEFFAPHLKDSSYILTPYYTFYIYLQFAKLLSILFMNANRYTSVNFPVVHKTVWIVHLKKVIVFVVLFPLLFVWPVAISKTSFLPYNGQSIITYDHAIPWARTTYGRILIGGFTLVFTIFSCVKTTSKLSKLGKHMKRVEVSMNAAMIFVSGGFLLFLALQVSYLVFSTETLLQHQWLAMAILICMQISNDFYMLSGPVVLLILDKRIRSSVFCCFRHHRIDSKKATMEVQPVTVTHMY